MKKEEKVLNTKCNSNIKVKEEEKMWLQSAKLNDLGTAKVPSGSP